jgi:hypothetical protein
MMDHNCRQTKSLGAQNDWEKTSRIMGSRIIYFAEKRSTTAFVYDQPYKLPIERSLEVHGS